MFERARGRLLAVLRVPGEPEAVAEGRAERVFRAAPNYFRYKQVLWFITQAAALIALVVGLVIAPRVGARIAERVGSDLVPLLIVAAELLAVATFLVQLPLSWLILRLDFEMRWYILTDRSLRIREGVLHLREKTMTFANIQQITIRENPLQRLLGIADVKVRTAGGGGGEGGDGEIGESMHEAYFRGVDNAEEIRSAIRDRVRLYRDAGLGDPDEASPAAGAPAGVVVPGGRPAAGGGGDAVAAARQLLDEVRLLRSRLAAGQRAD